MATMFKERKRVEIPVKDRYEEAVKKHVSKLSWKMRRGVFDVAMIHDGVVMVRPQEDRDSGVLVQGIHFLPLGYQRLPSCELERRVAGLLVLSGIKGVMEDESRADCRVVGITPVRMAKFLMNRGLELEIKAEVDEGTRLVVGADFKMIEDWVGSEQFITAYDEAVELVAAEMGMGDWNEDEVLDTARELALGVLQANRG
jgi:hypothetical protein